MKTIIPVMIATTLVAGVPVYANEIPEADTIYYGSIYEADGFESTAQAMAVKDGTIVYMGDTVGAEDYKGESTELIDFNGNTVLPGFIDGHVHIYIAGENEQGFRMSLDNVSADGYLDVIRTYIEEHPDEEFYRGFGWLDTAFGQETPTAAMLDEICPDKPIFIESEDCHSCWINTCLLEKTGVTKDTPDPIGGKIVHDSDGNPNGCFRDTAMDLLVKPAVPVYSVEEYAEKILPFAQQTMASNGYTTYNDVIIDPLSADNICAGYAALAEEGKLLTNVNISLVVNNSDNYLEDLDHILELKDKYSSDQVRINDVKIFMDGIVESETAYVKKPYEKTDKCGEDRWPEEADVERLRDLATRVNDAGLVAHFHAIGDAAIAKALDTIEYAKENSENKDIRNVITHLQMLDQEDIPRLAELGVIASCNLGWSPSVSEDVGQKNIEKENVGNERNDAMYPFASILNAGITAAFATDYPAGPVLDALYNLESGVTRQTFWIDSTKRNADEAISIDDAIDMMTLNGAYQLYREDETGSLEVGKKADFIVLDNNILAADKETLRLEVAVAETYLNGERVYNAEN